MIQFYRNYLQPVLIKSDSLFNRKPAIETDAAPNSNSTGNGCPASILATTETRPSVLFVWTVTAMMIVNFLTPSPALSANVTLVWDPSGIDTIGYRLYQRTVGDVYDFSHPVWEGSGQTCTVEQADGDEIVYFVLRAYDTEGKESQSSNEVRYPPPMALQSVNGYILDVELTGEAAFKQLVCVETTSASTQSSPPEPLPYGLIDMEISVENAGDSVGITIEFPEPFSENNEWWILDSNLGWQDYTLEAAVESGETAVTLILEDGGEGDADHETNGIIVHRSGLGLRDAEPADEPSSASGSGGGGCFVASLPAALGSLNP